MTLELRDVSKRFTGIVAVDHVSFQARAGEVTGFAVRRYTNTNQAGSEIQFEEFAADEPIGLGLEG